jgi:hypothetical protein
MRRKQFFSHAQIRKSDIAALRCYDEMQIVDTPLNMPRADIHPSQHRFWFELGDMPEHSASGATKL